MVLHARRSEDLAVARRCALGEVEAERAIFERYKSRVHATLYRIVGSNADIEDLLQDTFLDVFASIAGFRGDSLLSTWIDCIAVRMAWAYLRSRKREVPQLALVQDVPSGSASAEDRTAAREAARRLYALLDRLEPLQRIAYTLHVVDGRPLAEVAKLMNAGVATTKIRAWRASRFIAQRAKHDPSLAGFVEEGEK